MDYGEPSNEERARINAWYEREDLLKAEEQTNKLINECKLLKECFNQYRPLSQKATNMLELLMNIRHSCEVIQNKVR